MGKTGGGAGSNQYGPHGRPKPKNARNGQRSHSDAPDLDLSVPARIFEADPAVSWDIGHLHLERIRPKAVERAVARWGRRSSNTVFNDQLLEGFTFTEPEVVTLIDNLSLGGDPSVEELQVADMHEAAQLASRLALAGPLEPSSELTDRMNAILARNDAIVAGHMRGWGNVYGSGTVSMGRGQSFHALSSADDAGEALRAMFDDGLARIAREESPLARGILLGAFMAYGQFYGNANKRTGKYSMNAILMSHGFDAIVTPAKRRDDYNRALTDMYTFGDLTSYATFLASLYEG